MKLLGVQARRICSIITQIQKGMVKFMAQKIAINKHVKTAIISVIIILSLITILFFTFQYNYVKGWSKLIYPGVKIDNIDLAGKTKEQALQILKQKNDDAVLERKINVKVGEKNYIIVYSKLGPMYNREEVVNEAYSYGKNLNLLSKANLIKNPQIKDYSLKFTYDQKAMNDFVNSIAKQIDVNPVNAQIKMVGAGFSITPDVKGVKLETASLLKNLISKVNGKVSPDINVDATTTITTATITAAKLTAVNAKISSFSTEFASRSSAQRANNIRLATRAINGLCIMPGGSFSFNGVVGERTVKKGYEAAPVDIGNKVGSGIGGGICQVSTTLYNSILKVNIKSTERLHHTLPSTYVPIGLDATVDYGNLDYRFKNTLAYPIYIQCNAEGGSVVFNIYSNSSLTKTTYDITNEVYDTIQPTTSYVNNSTLPKGTQVYVQQPQAGHKVRVHEKTIQSGKVISDEIISNDYYLPINGIIGKGTKS